MDILSFFGLNLDTIIDDLFAKLFAWLGGVLSNLFGIDIDM